MRAFAFFKDLSIKKQAGLLLIFWMLVQAGLFLSNGINTTLESLKYIGAANNLIYNGSLPETRYYFYLLTTLIIAFCLKTGLGYGGVVVIQLILNLFATFRFFKALLSVQQKNYSAFFTVLLLISFLPYQAWNFYLYTESVFYSFSLLFFSSCIQYRNFSGKGVFIQGLFLLMTIISRPLGIIFLPCWILFLAFQRKIKPVVIASFFIAASVIAVAVINTIMSTISDWQILKPAEFGYVICDIPSRTKLELEALKQYSPLTQLGLFIFQYPIEFLSLSAKRLSAFYLLWRSYYSTLHNIYMLGYAIIFALPFFYAMFFLRKNQVAKSLLRLSVFIVTGFTLAIVLQCDDYHNRFHHTIVPVFLFAGVFHLLEKTGAINFNK